MRKIILLSASIFSFSFIGQAQIYTPNGQIQGSSGNNNVGIGTSNPTSKLFINSGYGNGLTIKSESQGIYYPPVEPDYSLRLVHSSNVTFKLEPSGRVKIGNTNSYSNANQRLNVPDGFGLFQNNTNFLQILNNGNYYSRSPVFLWRSSQSGNDRNIKFKFHAINSNPLMSLTPEGKVGIGTEDFSGDYKLLVGGKIIGEEVVVKLQADWPDYVFAPDYELMSLEQTRDFIEKHKRLPGVSSAEKIKEDGLAVGETEALLMEKIEELTLHLIQMNDKLNSTQEELNKLKKELAEQAN